MRSLARSAFRISTPSERTSNTTRSPFSILMALRTSTGSVSWPFDDSVALLMTMLLTFVMR